MTMMADPTLLDAIATPRIQICQIQREAIMPVIAVIMNPMSVMAVIADL